MIWLVVEPTHLKNISQNGNLPQIGVKITNVWNHRLVIFFTPSKSPAILIPTSSPSPSPWPFHVPHAEGLLRSWSQCFLYDTSVEITKKMTRNWVEIEMYISLKSWSTWKATLYFNNTHSDYVNESKWSIRTCSHESYTLTAGTTSTHDMVLWFSVVSSGTKAKGPISGART